MNNAEQHISFINSLFKGIKSTLHTEFIQPTMNDIFIITNNVLVSNNLITIKKYTIEGIGYNNIFTFCLLQSLYLT